MDAIDKKILGLLQENGRITVKEITQSVALTAPAVSERIKRMERDGIIKGYTAVIDPDKLGRKLHAIINVSLRPADSPRLMEIVENNEMVVECHHVTGSYSYLIKIDAHDTAELEKSILEFQKIGSTNTQIILSTPIENKYSL
jgi:Lrp/AsnC family leucine-responsive transcriptional regulator